MKKQLLRALCCVLILTLFLALPAQVLADDKLIVLDSDVTSYSELVFSGKDIAFVGEVFLNYGSVYFDQDTRFGTLDNQGGFLESLDSPYYDRIRNSKSFASDDRCTYDFLSGLNDSQLQNRAVYDLLYGDKAVNTWLTLCTGKVYKEVESNDDDYMGFGYVKYLDKYYEEAQAGSYPFDSKAEFVRTNSSKTAVFIPGGNSDLFLPDSGTLDSSIYSLRGFSNNTLGDIPAADSSIVLTKEGSGTLTLAGDNSWYNGVFDLWDGRTLIKEEGSMFGGEVNIYEGATLVWEGGANDAYNKPKISMSGGELELLRDPTAPENTFSALALDKFTISSDSTLTLDVSGLSNRIYNLFTTSEGVVLNGNTLDLNFSNKNPMFTYALQSTGTTLQLVIGAPFYVPIEPDTNDKFDDIKDHWAKDYINKLAGAEYIDGVGNRKFAPESLLTRAQLVRLIYNTLADGDTGAPSDPFTDTDPGAWYTAAINWAFAKDILEGYSETAFGPDDYVTREQIAALFFRAAEAFGISLPDNMAVTALFSDDAEISDYAKEAVYTMRRAGIISGKDDNLFDPLGGVTRAEAAKMLCLLLQFAGYF